MVGVIGIQVPDGEPAGTCSEDGEEYCAQIKKDKKSGFHGILMAVQCDRNGNQNKLICEVPCDPGATVPDTSC